MFFSLKAVESRLSTGSKKYLPGRERRADISCGLRKTNARGPKAIPQQIG
jgi:hypothetical protein